MSSTRNSYLALKAQASATTVVVPTHFLRYKSGDLELQQETIVNNPIQNNRSVALNAVQGKVQASGNYKFDLDANECVHMFYNSMGTLVTADISSGTDASAFSQTIDTANTLPYFTLEQGKGALTDTTNNRINYQVSRAIGAMVDSWTLRGSNGLLELDAKIMAHGVFERAKMLNNQTATGSPVSPVVDQVEGLTATESINIFDETPQNEARALTAVSVSAGTVTVAALTNSYTVANNAVILLTPQTPSFSVAAQVFSFAHVNFGFGASVTAAKAAAEDNIENWELQFMNNLEERYGSQRFGPSVVEPRGYKLTLKFTKYFASRQDANYFLNRTRRACSITITNGTIISATDTGNKKYQVQINISDLRFIKYNMPTATDALYAYTIEAEAFYDSGDAKVFQVVVQNASAGTVYTA